MVWRDEWVREIWLSILDERTTLVCLDAHGMVRNPPEPFLTAAGNLDGPPAHWGCRSIVDVMILKAGELTRKDSQGRRYEKSLKEDGRTVLRQRRQDWGLDKWKKEWSKARSSQVPEAIKVCRSPCKTLFESGPDLVPQFRAAQAIDDLGSLRAELDDLHTVYERYVYDALDHFDDLKAQGYWGAMADDVTDQAVKLKMLVADDIGKTLVDAFDFQDLVTALEHLVGRDVLMWIQTTDSYAAFGLQHAVGYELAKVLTSQWAATSGDSSLWSLVLQRSAARQFGLPWPPPGYFLTPDLIGRVDTVMSGTMGDIVDVYVQAQYRRTQAMLAGLEVDTVSLVRGVDDVFGAAYRGQASTQLNPLSSFTHSADSAGLFGREIIVMQVPTERLLATPMTGVGCLLENEWVVIGGEVDSVMVLSADDLMELVFFD